MWQTWHRRLHKDAACIELCATSCIPQAQNHGAGPATLPTSPCKQLHNSMLTPTLGEEGAAATCCHWK